MRKDKRGQAAMEFLMTYGWAILAAIVVIGILGYYYFGSDIMTPRSGVVQPPFYLNAHNVNTTSVNLEIQNNGGETYNVQNLTISGCDEDGYLASPVELAPKNMTTFSVACDVAGSPGSEGDSFSGDITITYTKEGSSLAQTSTGSVTDIVV